MKKLLIISGKGGTGKTTLSAAFIHLAGAQTFADCDVDAPNLHLALKQDVPPQETDYIGMPAAKIENGVCAECGKCADVCSFGAISKNGYGFQVDPYSCESCGLCARVCEYGAITLEENIAGKIRLYQSGRVFVTAKLKMGSGTSGKLVSEVKKSMCDNAKACKLAIVDGSPGIGCPVISSLSGMDLALIVAEPSLSGISDLHRVAKTAEKCGVPVAVCVNKADVNLHSTDKIVKYCKDNNISFMGKIPFDKMAVKAADSGKSIAEIDCPGKYAVVDVFKQTMELMNLEA